MIKQTQTKMFDFSDVGLDFCSGSKNKFPEVFKKMLATGYNPQTAASVSITGSQVTFTFGVNHGYAADRVLLVSATGGFSKEVYIDSVTSNTITFTQSVTTGLSGTITTKVASLGWELVYELNHIHIYKFKHIDDSDMFARLCFQNATTTGNRNCIAVGIGRTANLSTGVITDSNCFSDLASCATVADATSNIRWDFTNSTARTDDNYTYSQGVSFYGKGMVIGSKYHILICCDTNRNSSSNQSYVMGIVPTVSILNFPLLLASNNGASTTATNSMNSTFTPYIAKNRCIFDLSIATNPSGTTRPQTNGDYLPSDIEPFETMMGKPIPIHLHNPSQFVGFASGIFIACSSSTVTWNSGKQDTPAIESDVDFNNLIIRKGIGDLAVFIPIEEIKIAS